MLRNAMQFADAATGHGAPAWCERVLFGEKNDKELALIRWKDRNIP
jgi:hypothetical protein